MISAGQIRIIYPDSPIAIKVAKRLEYRLLHYRVPLSVSKQRGTASIADVKEQWLIVVCIPETRNDTDILEQIGDFIAAGKGEHILTVLVKGQMEDSCPKCLLHKELEDGRIIDVEPLAANLTADSELHILQRVRQESLRIMASILGVSYDELNRRAFKRKQRFGYAIGTFVIMCSVVFLAYSVDRKNIIEKQGQDLAEQYDIETAAKDKMLEQQKEAVYQKQVLWAEKARAAYEEYDMHKALYYCLEGYGDYDAETSADELNEVYADVISVLTGTGYVPVTNNKAYYAVYGNNRRFEEPDKQSDSSGNTYTLNDGHVYSCVVSKGVSVWDITEDTLVRQIECSSVFKYALSSDGMLAVITGDSIEVYDIYDDSEAMCVPLTAISNSYISFVKIFNGEHGKYSNVYGAEILDSGQIAFEYHEEADDILEIIERNHQLF